MLTEVPVNAEVARMTGYSLRPFPSSQARRLIADALIGCSALHRNIPLYSRNVRDMQNFAGAIQRY